MKYASSFTDVNTAGKWKFPMYCIFTGVKSTGWTRRPWIPLTLFEDHPIEGLVLGWKMVQVAAIRRCLGTFLRVRSTRECQATIELQAPHNSVASWKTLHNSNYGGRLDNNWVCRAAIQNWHKFGTVHVHWKCYYRAVLLYYMIYILFIWRHTISMPAINIFFVCLGICENT